MNNEKLRRITHNLAIRTSSNLFNLSGEEKSILHTITKDGPQILSDLVKKTSKYGEWEIPSRWVAKRRLYGTGLCMGLVPHDYIVEKEHEKRIRGKDGEIFCLTTKGMLASLSTKVSLEKSYLFKKYIEFIRNILNRKIEHIGQQKNINTDLDEQSKNWLLNIFKNYIKYQIYTFLIWHEANEISLQRKKSFDWYINEFYRMHDEFINLEFPQDIDSGLLNEYKIILRQNKMYSKMIHSLNHVYDIKTTKKNEEKIEALRENLAMVATYVLEWYLYFDKKQLYEDINKTYSVKPILSFMPSDPKIGIDIEYSGTIGFKKLIKPDLRKIVKDSMQKELGLDIQINEIWKKPNKKPKMLSYGSIPV